MILIAFSPPADLALKAIALHSEGDFMVGQTIFRELQFASDNHVPAHTDPTFRLSPAPLFPVRDNGRQELVHAGPEGALTGHWNMLLGPLFDGAK